MDRAAAWELLREFTSGESLLKHALAVEACMRAYARHFGEDEERWGVAGLIHDFDYERHPTPDLHPARGSEILAQRGYPEDVRRAILGHANYSGVPRDTPMARALYACDELAGFLTAVSLVKPGKSIFEVEPRSVRRKMKDKAFARSVNRQDIIRGAAELGVDLDQHISFCIEAMKACADRLGLRGTPPPGGGPSPDIN